MNPYRTPLLLAGLCIAPLLSCVSRGAFDKEKGQRELAETKWNELSRYQSELESDRRALKAEVAQLRLLVDERTKTAEEASGDRLKYREKLDELEKRLGALGDPGSGDVQIYQTAEGTVVEIKEGVLFDSGVKAIKSKGKDLLSKLSIELANSTNDIRVEGHTDSDPVVKHAKEYPMGNLQLSSERALEVANFLMKGAATPIAESRLYVAGFGPNRPRADGKSVESKSKNRRVDLVLLKNPMDKADIKSAIADPAATPAGQK